MTIPRQALHTMLLLAALSGLAACYRGKDISESLDKAVLIPHAGEVRLADLTRFDWDSLYLFGGYTARENICKTIQLEIDECARQIPFEWVAESNAALLFLSKGDLVHAEQHAYSKGEFKPLPESQPLTPTTAVFRIVRTPSARVGDPDIELVLK